MKQKPFFIQQARDRHFRLSSRLCSIEKVVGAMKRKEIEETTHI